MNADEQSWQEQCRAAGIDPAEVRLVLGRYRSYRDYYDRLPGTEPLSLDAWFRFYRMEVATETGQQAPAPAAGCSVDEGARHRGALHNPKAFLRALVALVGLLAARAAAQ
jgi:hypothetical protein